MSNTVVDILSDLLKIKHEKLIMDLLPSVCDSFQPYKYFMEYVGVKDREQYDITTYYKDFNVENCVNLDLSLLYDDFIKACYVFGDESVKKLLILFVFMSCLSNYNEKSLLKGVYESIVKWFKSEAINSKKIQSITINNINNTYLNFVLKKKAAVPVQDYEPLEKLALIHITSKVSADNVIKWASITPTLDNILNTETQMKNSSIYSFISWYYKNPQNKVYNFMYTNTDIVKYFKLLQNLLKLLMLFSCDENMFEKVKNILDKKETDENKISELKNQDFVKSYLTKLLELKNSKTDKELKEKLQFIRNESTIRKDLNTITSNSNEKKLQYELNNYITTIDEKILEEIKECINIYQIKSKFMKDIKGIKDINTIKVYLTDNITVLQVLEQIQKYIGNTTTSYKDRIKMIKGIIFTFKDNNKNTEKFKINFVNNAYSISNENINTDIKKIFNEIINIDNIKDILSSSPTDKINDSEAKTANDNVNSIITKINITESKDILTSIEKVMQDDITSTLFFHILSSK